MTGPDGRALILAWLRRVEAKPSLLGASAHLLAILRSVPTGRTAEPPVCFPPETGAAAPPAAAEQNEVSR
ncbi:MAG: hypothetical protein WEF86_00555 [Gemmatimonadota bacterium]